MTTPLPISELERLPELAEKATPRDKYDRDDTWRYFQAYADPPTIKSLIEEVMELRKLVKPSE